MIFVVMVVGVVFMGWNFGFFEGICFVILIGFSVDYVVYIGYVYVYVVCYEGVSCWECVCLVFSVMGFFVFGVVFIILCVAFALF